jgi:hypothetical protein
MGQLKSQMLHGQTAIDELFQRINSNPQMFVEELLGDLGIARFGLDAFGTIGSSDTSSTPRWEFHCESR